MAKTLPLPCVSIALGMIGIISKKCIVEGHLPPPEAQPFYDRVAYCGLVPCKVRGSWRSGDCLVPSGRKDGTATAQRSGLFGVSATVGRTVGASSKSGKSSIYGKLEDDGQPRMAECVVVGPSLTSALGGLLLTPGPLKDSSTARKGGLSCSDTLPRLSSRSVRVIVAVVVLVMITGPLLLLGFGAWNQA